MHSSQAYEQKENQYAEKLAAVEDAWRKKVQDAMADMSAHPALESLRRENDELKQQLSSLTAQLRQLELMGAAGAGKHSTPLLQQLVQT